MLWSWKELGLSKIISLKINNRILRKIIIPRNSERRLWEVKITSWRSKMAMKDMVATKADDESNSDPMSNLNDL
jgi:hypothetical protein